MTPEQRDLVLSLVVSPGGPAPISPELVLRGFGTADGVDLARRLLREAITSRSAVDLQMALIVTSVFGMAADFIDPLIGLVVADWHQSHEDLVTLLGQFKTPRAVPALRKVAEWVPEYLDFDESRALAVKAIHALARVSEVQATEALEKLSSSKNAVVAQQARLQLHRRRS